MANGTAKITRTFGTPTNNIKWTWSGWVKTSMAQEQGLFFGYVDANNYSFIGLNSNGQIQFYNHVGGSASHNMKISRYLRDWSAFYHIVVAYDSANVTESDRIKIYVNGVQETSFATSDYPSASAVSKINGAWLHEVGAKLGTYDFSGVMSHVQFVDGSALAPTAFAETDATSGIWKIKTGAYATPGNNGYFLKMEDRTNLDLDSSSNANTFATTGTLTATYDNPSNNFPTIARFLGIQGTAYYTNTVQPEHLIYGNLRSTSGTNDKSMCATMAVHKGKWYWETKLYGNNNTRNLGILRADMIGNNAVFINGTTTAGSANTINYNPRTASARVVSTDKAASGTVTTGMASTDSDCIVGHFLDMDNGKICWSLNGTLINSGTSFSLPNWADGDWTLKGAFPSARLDHTQVGDYNFGNGYFGTTAVSSSVADAGGIGSFEYNPTATIDSSSQDFRTICTKNIKEYG